MEQKKPFMPPPPKELRNLPPLPPKKVKEDIVILEEKEDEKPTLTLDVSIEEEAKKTQENDDNRKINLHLVFCWTGFVVSLALWAVFLYLLIK